MGNEQSQPGADRPATPLEVFIKLRQLNSLQRNRLTQDDLVRMLKSNIRFVNAALNGKEGYDAELLKKIDRIVSRKLEDKLKRTGKKLEGVAA